MAAAGYLAILVAFVSAVALAVQGVRVSRSGAVDPARLRIPVFGLAAGGIAAFLVLEIAILTHDFSIAYVAKNTALGTPFIFLLAAAWAALQGSVVLWGLMLSVFTWLVWRRVKVGDGLGVLALAVMGFVAIFWFRLMPPWRTRSPSAPTSPTDSARFRHGGPSGRPWRRWTGSDPTRCSPTAS